MASTKMSEVVQHLRRTVLLRDGAGLTDAQLLDNYLRHREEAALAALVWRHGPMVWGVCRRILRGHHDAEDAFQATFLVLVRKAGSIASRDLLANWLYGVAHQTALKARSTAAKRRERERQATVMPEVAAPAPYLWAELEPLLDYELSCMPEKYRAVIVLCELEGRTRKETARQLQVPEGTVAGRLARARALLASRLARRGVMLSSGSIFGTLAHNAATGAVPATVSSAAIRAASSFATGQTAAMGAISVKAAALTERVMRTMLITKLKMAAALLLAASTIAVSCGVWAGQQQSAHPHDAATKQQIAPKDDLARLQGTWRLISAEMDGLSIGEGRQEIKDTRLVFEKSTVELSGKTFHSPGIPLEPEDTKSVGIFTLDAKKNPRTMVFTLETNPWNNKKNFVHQYIYSLDGDNLKLCSILPNEASQLPVTEFSAKSGSKRGLWIFKRDRPPEKGGATQQKPSPAENANAPTNPAEPGKNDKSRLQGSWRMLTLEWDGLKLGEGRPELADSRLVIKKAEFSPAIKLSLREAPEKQARIEKFSFVLTLDLLSAGDPTKANKAIGHLTLDADPASRVMVLTWAKCPWNGKEDFAQKVTFALDGDSLVVCLGVGDDGKAPTEFAAPTDSKRHIWTFRREWDSKKGDEKLP
jgi:RNA polymerase sigma factor (sigma-70 family)